MNRLNTAFCMVLLLAVLACAGPGPGSTAKDQIADVGGARLAMTTQGTGVPVVFVHGALSDRRTWENQRAAFAERYRFIAYSQRYFGLEAWPDDGATYGPATHAADLIALIQSLGAGPVHVVAWSYGGAVATLAALERPELFRSLSMHEPGLSGLLVDRPEAASAVASFRSSLAPAMQAATGGDLQNSAKRFIEGVYGMQPGSFDQAEMGSRSIILDNARTLTRALRAPSPAVNCQRLAGLKVPTLVLGGVDSIPYFRHINEAYVRCAPSARLVTLANSGHDSPRKVPDAFNRAVLDFLAER